MTSLKQNFQKMRKVSSQNLVKVICVNFHQNRPNGVEIKCCDGQTYRHTDTQTGLVPGVNIFSNEMTEYKNNFYGSHFLYFFPIQKYVQILGDNSQS